jgi:hypothetical protein
MDSILGFNKIIYSFIGNNFDRMVQWKLIINVIKKFLINHLLEKGSHEE